MLELAREKNNYIRKDISKEDAIAFYQEKGDEYKLELLEGLEDGNITFYTQGNFTIYVVDHTFQTQALSKQQSF